MTLLTALLNKLDTVNEIDLLIYRLAQKSGIYPNIYPGRVSPIGIEESLLPSLQEGDKEHTQTQAARQCSLTTATTRRASWSEMHRSYNFSGPNNRWILAKNNTNHQGLWSGSDTNLCQNSVRKNDLQAKLEGEVDKRYKVWNTSTFRHISKHGNIDICRVNFTGPIHSVGLWNCVRLNHHLKHEAERWKLWI